MTSSTLSPSVHSRYAGIATRDYFFSCSEFPFPRGLPALLHDTADDADRRKLLEMHIKSNGYFATIATLLDLMVREKEKIDTDDNRLLRQLRDDFLYLQKYYHITKKPEA